ncbi:hypothetical protein QBA54_05360 [Streptomyces sp. B21-108]|uniref:hypothetical protein n=1 Tax=Streptomyces sp. B21-108 TaxID=3039419 RepID=UPI002FF0E420
MFEGYAGTSDSGFRDEVEAEQALARGQLLAEMGADEDRPTLTGPAGAEAEARLAEFARTPPSTARSSLTKPACAALWPATTRTCTWGPSSPASTTPTAPCAALPTPPGDGRPVLADCQPLACRNTALTPANRQALNGHLTKLEEALANRDHIAPYVCHRLEEQHREAAAFLARHAPEPAE